MPLFNERKSHRNIGVNLRKHQDDQTTNEKIILKSLLYHKIIV